MPVQFAVLASGSRGNSTLIRGRGAGLLIDVGIGPRALQGKLESVGAGWPDVAGVVLTHTHGDHVDSGTFAELARRRIALLCHEGHRANLGDNAGFQRLEEAGLVTCYDDQPALTATGLRLEPIRLRHDGGPTYGFRIEVSTERRGKPVSIGYLADTGSWSESMIDCLADVDVLGVEFNHDVAMQRSSGRSGVLIARNLGEHGHLSNRQGAALVEAVLARSRRVAMQHLVLLHLSEQCNHPGLAIEAARAALGVAGRQVAVHAAQQSSPHPNLWVLPGRRSFRDAGPAPVASGLRRPTTASRTARSVATPVLAGLFDGDRDQDIDTVGTL
ncbi:MAG: MBL fold metallo-hydrolase [Isosphaeraceae bacterium]